MNLENDMFAYVSTTTIANHIVNRQNELILHFFDMELVASTLEDSIVLSNPIIYHTPGKLREVEQAQYEEDRALAQKYRTKNIKLCKKFDKQVETRRMLFSTIREVYPTFCKDIDKKIPEEDYLFYMQQQKKMRRILVAKRNSGLEMSSADYTLERKDKISELVDSEDFSKACIIEDKFVISELKKYLELLRTVPKEIQYSQRKNKIPYKDANSNAETLVRISMENRSNRILKLKQILELFDKMKSKKYAEFPDKDDD